MSQNLPPADTRIFLFHSADAASDPGGATDRVNEWLGKDRSAGTYSGLRVREITTSPDGHGGVYFTVVCTLGHVREDGPAARTEPTLGAAPQI
ncbi:MAG TPA: hypothetical protein VGT61_14355 [Thermomicrobiales bacterium]|jgi:hypothetical protein|nr:hypothetical protein [Thermomicrobiales bacterium]